MHIGLVGGIDRNAHHYSEMAEAEGHTVECHTGHLAGRGSDALASLVERSDLVVVITDVNSHAGMWGARRLAKARGRRCVLVRKMGAARFRQLLSGLDSGLEAGAEGSAEPHCRATAA
ncbi:MAG TPA: DUF2325 domain-containing protein [Polyangiaceae bacterium]